MCTNESKIEADIEQPIFKPSKLEFANFAQFVKTLKERGCNFALVSFGLCCLFLVVLKNLFVCIFDFQVEPPKSWSSNSRQLEDNTVLQSLKQSVEEIAHNVYHLINETVDPITYGQFKSEAMAAKIEIDDEKSIEDMCWSMVTKDKSYAANNPVTLFNMNVDIWNLDKFTKDESNIHSKPSHRLLKVSVFWE